MITENLSTLKIHNLTKEQYERELAAGRIDENALYLTPYEETDLSPYATLEYVNESKVDKENFERIALRCSEIGMTPNDDNGDNFALLCDAIVRADKVLVDGMYKLTTTSVYTLDTNVINIVGETLNSGFDVSNCWYLFNVSESCIQLSLKNLTFNNSSDDIGTVLFLKNDYVTPRMDFVEMSGCNIFGNISPFRFYQNAQINPNEADIGVNVIRITDNTVSNIRMSFAVFTNVSFDLLEVSGNIIRNFDNTFVSIGVTNDSPYAKEIVLNMHMVSIHDNDVYCDCATNESDLTNAWWGSETNDSYYAFVVCESTRVHYSKNRVEGMKSKNPNTALYDAYLSSKYVMYDNNIWKNNCVFNSATINNSMLKAKEAIGDIGFRNYHNNIFVVEENFFTLHGMTVNDSNICLMSSSKLMNWDIQNNLFECPKLCGTLSGNVSNNITFKNNTVNVGDLHNGLIKAVDIIFDGNSIFCKNGTNASIIETGEDIAKHIILCNNTVKNVQYTLRSSNAEELTIYNNIFIDEQPFDYRVSVGGTYGKVIGYNNKIIKNSGRSTPFGGGFTENITYTIENCTDYNKVYTPLMLLNSNQNSSVSIEIDGLSVNTGLPFSGKIFFEINNEYFSCVNEDGANVIQKMDVSYKSIKPKVLMSSGRRLPVDIVIELVNNICQLSIMQLSNEKILWTMNAQSSESSAFIVPEIAELPIEYKQVYYLETDGGQHIDTGVLASNYQDGIHYIFNGALLGYAKKRNVNTYLFGTVTSGRSGYIAINPYNVNAPCQMLLGGSGTAVATMTQYPELGKDFTFEITCSTNATENATAFYNGEALTIQAGTNCEMPNSTISLFSCTGAYCEKYVGKLYKFTMNEIDGTPIRNFVPCYRIADNVVGLYDTVGSQFYTNAGTGSFIAGPLVS